MCTFLSNVGVSHAYYELRGGTNDKKNDPSSIPDIKGKSSCIASKSNATWCILPYQHYRVNVTVLDVLGVC
ncbi:hypothetical protein PV325_000552 [Microctonus aethiopoides]|nr:hypothetical protein PV325_000552 [Microctonus aethiopoides]